MSMFASQWFASTGASAYLLEQSLLFNDDDSAYLNRTPSVAGNRKTWTFSAWVKRGTLDTASTILSAGADSSNYTRVNINASNKVTINYVVGGSNVFVYVSTAVFRDTSSWYHIVASIDTTEATSTNRVKVWVNGTQITAWDTSTAPSQNTDTDVNSTDEHNLGRVIGGAYYDGLMALPILVDGAALAPTDFGETDDDGFWNPIEFDATTITDAAPTVTFIGTNTDNTNNNSVYTFSSESIGTADANRQVILAVNGKRSAGAGLAINSCTIGGVAARVLVEEDSIDAQLSAFVIANVPSGTTGDIVITFNANSETCAIGVYTTVIENPVIWATAQDSGSTTLVSATLNTPTSNGFALACVTQTDSGNNPSCVFTGVTEDADLAYDTNQGFAIGSATVSAGSLAISGVINTDGNNNRALSCIHVSGRDGFGPNGFQLDFADTADFGKDVSSTRTALTANYVTSVSNDGGGGFATSPVTFSSVDIGTASATRKVIVGVGIDGYQGNEAYTSLTIGGVAANLIQEQNAASGGRPVALYELDVSSGTSADIVVTFTGTQTKCYSMGIGVWTIEGGTLFSTVGSTANPGAGNISVSSGGTVIAIMTEGNASATYTWANLTENFDNQVRSGRQAFSGASKNLSSATTQAISATSSGGSQFAMLAASFAPANDYLSNNFTTSDQLEDTPTDSADDGIGNFATLNPNDNGGGTLSQGNRYFALAADKSIRATMSGTEKYQIECFGQNEMMFGLASAACPLTGSNHYLNANSFMYRGYNGNKVNTSFSSYGSASTTDSTYVGMTYDPSNGDLRFYLNGTDQGTAFTMDTSVEWYPYIFGGSTSQYLLMNFGQTAFEHPISGFTPLATQNLPAPTIADGSQYFNTVLWTGDGTSPRKITTGFAPDLIWIKNRTDAAGHQLFDTLRDSGTEPYLLASNSTAAETVTGRYLANLASNAFDTDGFNLSSTGNVSAKEYVAWCWKAGGAASSNTDGSITTSVSANTTSGFSIISYTGTGASYPTPTIGHGLGSAPKFYIIKNRDQTDGWAAFHEDMNANPWNDRHLRLDTNAAVSGALNVSGAAPTSSIIYLDSDHIVNASSEDYICYAWSEVEGFSKFGSYTGNANVDGPFIYLGFRPAFILEKRVDSAGAWYITDMTRDTYNPVNKYLMPDASNAEASGSTSSGVYLDALSNGYKIRGAGAGQEYNRSGGTYIYAAYAENPFQGDDGVTQARAR